MPETLTFPSAFRFGAATSAHQTEGGNTNADWWDFELAPGSGCAEPSGDACDSWHRWADDVALCAEMNLDVYRFSVEWARIEPAPGEFSAEALTHYRTVAAALRERGIEPMVTLNHFTLPRWVAAEGGWESDSTVDRFARYAERTAAALAAEVSTFFTLNEPNVVATLGYYQGRYPPGVKDDLRRAWAAHENLRAAHAKGGGAVRGAVSGAKVGLTLSMEDWLPDGNPGAEQMIAACRAAMEDPYLELARKDELVGVQAYSCTRIGAAGPAPAPADAPLTQLGTEIWPQALAACVRYAWQVTGGEVPLLVTENGIGTADDSVRIDYTRRSLAGLHAAMAGGIDVVGYLHWSLLDNFEWDLGLGPTFGLAAVDHTTFDRTLKPSGHWYGQIARSHNLEV